MKAPRPPITYAHENIIFAGPRDPWALYRLAPQSYPGLPVSGKHELKNYLEAFAYRVDTADEDVG